MAPADLLDARSWAESPVPVLTGDDTTKQYGPGRNCFTVAEDGRTDVLVHHARQYKEITGDPLHGPNRHTRAQKLGWKPDGTPDLRIRRRHCAGGGVRRDACTRSCAACVRCPPAR
ncbi:family 43 glycosylhydrolase [Streptomyces olivaceoviridis]|uniref:family 43 glycosylhydrolase n=1 Tax=Streptomyces olivaceoviridis TaxID=1921 RepID=UPI003D9EC95C